MGIVTFGLRIAGETRLVCESSLVLFKGYPIAIMFAHRKAAPNQYHSSKHQRTSLTQSSRIPKVPSRKPPVGLC